MSVPKILTADQLPALEPRQVIQAMRDAFRDLARGRALQPSQTVVPLDNGGDVISYPAVMMDDDLVSIKLSPYIPRPDAAAIITAWTLLLDTRTGEPVALLDSKWLTTKRTSATTALAVDLLAVPEAGILTIVGSGPAALAHLDYLRTVRPFQTIRLFSRRNADLVIPGVDIVHEKAAIEDSDVVALCTSAAEAVIDVSRFKPTALITSISSNAPGAREIDPADLGRLDVYCDYAPSADAIAEFTIAADSGNWSTDAIRGDLPSLVAGTCPLPSRERPTFFRSIGLGLEDAAIARLATLG